MTQTHVIEEVDQFLEEELVRMVQVFAENPHYVSLTGPVYRRRRENEMGMRRLMRQLPWTIVEKVWEEHGPRHADGKLWQLPI